MQYLPATHHAFWSARPQAGCQPGQICAWFRKDPQNPVSRKGAEDAAGQVQNVIRHTGFWGSQMRSLEMPRTQRRLHTSSTSPLVSCGILLNQSVNPKMCFPPTQLASKQTNGKYLSFCRFRGSEHCFREQFRHRCARSMRRDWRPDRGHGRNLPCHFAADQRWRPLPCCPHGVAAESAAYQR